MHVWKCSILLCSQKIYFLNITISVLSVTTVIWYMNRTTAAATCYVVNNSDGYIVEVYVYCLWDRNKFLFAVSTSVIIMVISCTHECLLRYTYKPMFILH